eukprot:646696-Rhodomonas_salina.5
MAASLSDGAACRGRGNTRGEEVRKQRVVVRIGWGTYLEGDGVEEGAGRSLNCATACARSSSVTSTLSSLVMEGSMAMVRVRWVDAYARVVAEPQNAKVLELLQVLHLADICNLRPKVEDNQPGSEGGSKLGYGGNGCQHLHNSWLAHSAAGFACSAKGKIDHNGRQTSFFRRERQNLYVGHPLRSVVLKSERLWGGGGVLGRRESDAVWDSWGQQC